MKGYSDWTQKFFCYSMASNLIRIERLKNVEIETKWDNNGILTLFKQNKIKKKYIKYNNITNN